MTSEELRSALNRDGHDIPGELFARAVDALAGSPGADGLPNLNFLPAESRVAVLAALYCDFIEQVLARLGRPVS